MAVVGPGAVQEQEQEVKSLLDGASEYEYVTILNPLSDDFAVRVGVDVPVNMPQMVRSATGAVQNERDMLHMYGDTFKNPDFQGRKHVVNDTIIKAGQTINLKGNEAQVAVRQLVNEVLQREGKKRLMADPNLRLVVERRIIQGRGSVQELMDERLQSTSSQIDKAISKSNEANDEQSLSGSTELDQPTGQVEEASSNSGTDGLSQERRGPGRPRKD